MERTQSDQFEYSSDVDLFFNRNVDWIGGRFTKVCYVIFVFLLWGLLHVSRYFSPGECWTVTHVVHLLSTFVLFHWIKGCPDDTSQGDYNHLTLFEQIDAGVPWTTTKKFLMLVPTLITWVACHTANYESIFVTVNCGMFLIEIIAKIPQMHRVRIFGINSTAGIDTPVRVKGKAKSG